MNKPKFTQGPWKSGWVGEKPHGAAVVWIPDSSTCNERVEVHTSNARANARLIAIAPEMHALLKAVLPILEDCAKERHRMHGETRLGEHRDKLRELLAKVEGEE